MTILAVSSLEVISLVSIIELLSLSDGLSGKFSFVSRDFDFSSSVRGPPELLSSELKTNDTLPYVTSIDNITRKANLSKRNRWRAVMREGEVPSVNVDEAKLRLDLIL